MLDLGELVKRAIKYLVEGLMVAIAAYAIPKKGLNLDEVYICEDKEAIKEYTKHYKNKGWIALMKNMPMSIQVFKKLMHRYFHDEEAVILALLIVASAITLYFVGNILAPIIAAFIIAYVLTPLVDKLIAIKVSYLLANVLVYLLFLSFLMLFILVLAPLIVRQTTNFLGEAPNMIRDVIVMLQYLPLKYPELFTEAMVQYDYIMIYSFSILLSNCNSSLPIKPRIWKFFLYFLFFFPLKE